MEPATQANIPLLKAIARGRRWAAQLRSGEKRSIRAVAHEAGVTERYVSRILRCAFLAPDVVEAIVEGRHPPTLVLEDLGNDLPRDWTEQRKLLKFSTA